MYTLRLFSHELEPLPTPLHLVADSSPGDQLTAAGSTPRDQLTELSQAANTPVTELPSFTDRQLASAETIHI